MQGRLCPNCSKPHHCADHGLLIWQSLSCASRSENGLRIFMTFQGNLEQAQWCRRWAQSRGPMPATAEVFKPGALLGYFFFLYKRANFKPRLKAKAQGAEAIPQRQQIHPNPSEKQGFSWLQGRSLAEEFKLCVLWVAFGQQTPQETLTGSLASTSLTFALSHLAQQKHHGHLKQKSL